MSLMQEQQLEKTRLFLENASKNLPEFNNFDLYYDAFLPVIQKYKHLPGAKQQLTDFFKLSMRYKCPVGEKAALLYIIPFGETLQPYFTPLAYRRKYRDECNLEVMSFDFTREELEKLGAKIIPFSYENLDWRIIEPDKHTKENIAFVRVNSYRTLESKLNDETIYQSKVYTIGEIMKGVRVGKTQFWTFWSREMVRKIAIKKFIKEVHAGNIVSDIGGMAQAEFPYEYDNILPIQNKTIEKKFNFDRARQIKEKHIDLAV